MTGGATIDDLYDDAVDRLSAAGSPTPDMDATILIEHATGLTTLDRLTRPGHPVAHRQALAFETMLRRRLSFEPVHRIIGWREFYGLPLSLNGDTLVPRPDTEALVDLVLPFVRETAKARGICRILDLGTGSGAIALALLKEVGNARATGTDIAPAALQMAHHNARAIGVAERFTPLASDWFAKVTGRFDLIVSNPPYIPTGTISTLDTDVRDHDPHRALDGGADGLDAYGRIAARADVFLEPGGRIGLEIGLGQRGAVKGLFAAAGFGLLDVARDLGGRDRALLFAKA